MSICRRTVGSHLKSGYCFGRWVLVPLSGRASPSFLWDGKDGAHSFIETWKASEYVRSDFDWEVEEVAAGPTRKFARSHFYLRRTIKGKWLGATPQAMSQHNR